MYDWEGVPFTTRGFSLPLQLKPIIGFTEFHCCKGGGEFPEAEWAEADAGDAATEQPSFFEGSVARATGLNRNLVWGRGLLTFNFLVAITFEPWDMMYHIEKPNEMVELC